MEFRLEVACVGAALCAETSSADPHDDPRGGFYYSSSFFSRGNVRNRENDWPRSPGWKVMELELELDPGQVAAGS